MENFDIPIILVPFISEALEKINLLFDVNLTNALTLSVGKLNVACIGYLSGARD